MYRADKLVIFDWGGVIESHRYGEYCLNTAITNLIKHFNNNVNESNLIEKYFYVTARKLRQDFKEYTWFDKIKNEFNLQCNEDEFYDFYIKEFDKIEYYKDVVDYAHSLKSKCKIGILSNLGTIDKQRLDKQVDLKQFDYVWLSCELKYSKPNTKVYEIVENDCKFNPTNILFIDDVQANLEPAKEKGWNICNAFGYELDNIQRRVEEFLRK